MYLIKKETLSDEVKMDISFEKVVDDLLMISISSQSQKHGIPSYWRLTRVVGIPPLEVGIDCENGRFVSTTFYVDTSHIKESENMGVSLRQGNVLVDTEIFTKVNDYIDIDQAYEINILGNKLICAFMKVDEFQYSYRNGRIEIYVDSKNQIVGFSVCDLSTEEMEMINSLRTK